MSEDIMDGDSSGQEFGVVDLLIAWVVQLLHDVLQLSRIHITFRILERNFQFAQFYESWVICIHSLEFLSQIFDIFSAQHLHQYIECCLFQSGAPFEGLKFLEYFFIMYDL